MKILTSLFGLIIFLAGIYLTYWVFLDFEAFETLYLGLYLGGAFVLMTLGFYLFLLPLSFKSKKTKIDSVNVETVMQDTTPNDAEPIEDITDKVDDEEIEVDLTDVEDNQKVGDSTIVEDSIPYPVDDDPTIVQERIQNSNKDNDSSYMQFSLIQPSTIIESDDELETEINTSHIEQLNVTEIMDQPISEENQDTKLFNLNEQFDIYEFRVIGIETWSSQRILRKLTTESKLELSQKRKSGINMTHVTYNKKLIGFISRLDMNKINDRISQLIEVYPANIINDKHRIDHFSVKLKFKKEEVVHE